MKGLIYRLNECPSFAVRLAGGHYSLDPDLPSRLSGLGWIVYHIVFWMINIMFIPFILIGYVLFNGECGPANS